MTRVAEFRTGTNAPQVARGLHKAAEDLADLAATNAQAGRTVIGAARPPRRTGALAEALFSDADAQGVTMASRVGYFTPVHWGARGRNIPANPFLLAARRAVQDQVVGLYAAHARQSLTTNL